MLSLLRDQRGILTVATVMSVAASVLAMLQPVTLGWLIESVSGHRATRPAIITMIAVTLAESLVRGLQAYLVHATSENMVRGLRTQLVRSLLRLPIPSYQGHARGDLVSRMGTDSTQVRQVLTAGVMDVVSCGLLVGGALVIMTVIDPMLAAVTAAGVLLAALCIVPVAAFTKIHGARYQDGMGVLSGRLDAALSAVRLIRSYGAEDRQERQLCQIVDDVWRRGGRLARWQGAVEPVFGLATQGAFLTVLAIGGVRVAQGSMSIGELVSFLLYLLMAIMPIGQLMRAVTTVQSGIAALHRIREVVAQPLEVSSRTRLPAPVPQAPMLRFHHVTFEHAPGRGVYDIDLTVPEGGHLALVGPSGAGKTTLLSLVEQFYRPDRGTITFQGHDLSTLDPAALRRQVHLLEQNVPGLAASLAENLRLAAPDADDTDLLQALQEVGLGHLITAHGRDVLAHRLGDLGVKLSGGERQRLGWARLKLSRRRLVLLDEPTSNVDAVAERLFLRLMEELADQRTVVTVAHRLSTVRHADQIAVLADGRVRSLGRHQDLLNHCELYHRMARQQHAA